MIRRRDLITGAAALLAYGKLARAQSGAPSFGPGVPGGALTGPGVPDNYGFGTPLGGAGNSGPTLYTGPVATRAISAPNQFVTSLKQIMSRSYHFARDNITSLQIIVPNYYTAATAETAPGAVGLVTASIEYPAGTILAQILFSGAAQGTVPNGGILLSDSLTVSIPKNAMFFVRMYFTNTAGIYISSGQQDNPNGDEINYGASGVPDQTMTTTFTQNGDAGNFFTVAGIVGPTKLPSVYILDDSRGFGTGDTFSASGGDIGHVARSIGPTIAYINGGVGGMKAQTWAAGMPNQQIIAGMCSHITLGLAINDFSAGRTSTQILADRATIRGFFPSKKVFDLTTEPITTSTDSWATTTNQTVAPWNSDRVTFNTTIRALPNKFDVTSAIESSLNSGIWIASPSPPYTGDGTHETQTGYLLVQSSGVVNPALIHRP